MRPGNSSAQPAATGLSAKGLTRDDTENFNAQGATACQCRVKATVHQLPGARRRQVPRCDGCGNPISAGSALCETCASGAALVARVDARRAESLRRQSMGDLMWARG